MPRIALWALALVVLASSFATLVGTAQGAASNYALVGYAQQPGAAHPPVPAGVQVDLISRATGQVYTTTVAPSTSGQFTFNAANTGGTLAPGWWGVWVPTQANLSLAPGSGCRPCAILPENPAPAYYSENVTSLTTSLYPAHVTNVSEVAYTSALKGTVTLASTGGSVAGAEVQLLAPTFNNAVLVTNYTAANGSYALKAPPGTWVLKTTVPGPTTLYNLTRVAISGSSTTTNPVVRTYYVSGFEDQVSNPGAGVPNGGNVTVYDPENNYIYSSPTYPGGFYSFGTYPQGFDNPSGSQTFDVVLSPVGYTTVWYSLPVTTATPVTRNVLVAPLGTPQEANWQTTLNFSDLNVKTGAGNLTVYTNATLGNDSTLPLLANASVGQLWAQLGLDFNSSLSIPASLVPQIAAWEESSGPFFPAAQASTYLNGTNYLGNQTTPSFHYGTTCTSYCGLGSNANLNFSWAQKFPLNGTVSTNGVAYKISFNFAHPTQAEIYNYTVVLPTGFVLASGTTPPPDSALVPDGPGGTWTSFTLVSQPSPTTGGSAAFNIVKYGNLTANINATVPSYFAFSSKNILSDAHNNYTVIVGAGQKVAFSALNSSYPVGNNGTRFSWLWGDSQSSVTTTPFANHTYATVSGSTPYFGNLTVTSSGGLQNTVRFKVWVAGGPDVVTPVIASNATANQTFTTSMGVTYLVVNWSTVLYFNASMSKAIISSSTTTPGIVSVASFKITARNFNATANYSVSQGAQYWTNYTFGFNGAGLYLSNGTVAGVLVPLGPPSKPQLGWQYNVTLTVWDGAGHSASTTLVVLVVDKQRPLPKFQILGPSGTPVTGTGVIEASNHTAKISLNAVNSTDPNNGSVVLYKWYLNNSGNSSFHAWANQTATGPSYKLPSPLPSFWLAPQSTKYLINLTVTDRNGNIGYTTQTLTVSINSTLRPIMAANNLTAPSTLTSGSTYSIWVNITVGGGSKAVGQGIQVVFYLLSPSGTGSQRVIAGSPGTVRFYNYSSGVVNATPFATGSIASLSYNTTVRAEISWTPGITGSYNLYANVTATNEFAADYVNGPNVATPVGITINQNPVVLYEEYGAIAAVAVLVIVALVLYWRRRTGRSGAKSTAPGTGRFGLGRGRRDEDEEDEDEDKDT